MSACLTFVALLAPVFSQAWLCAHPIDDAVNQRLASKRIQPAPLCTDAEFLRRACLDLMGTLPTAEQARTFLADATPSPIKRLRLVDWILEQPAFADYWAMRWGDVLRIKSEFPSNLWPNAVQAYHAWLRDAFASDKPFDQLARELLLTQGSNFRQPAVNFYRALPQRTPTAIAGHVAVIFMGVRLDPASSASDGFAAYFTVVHYKPSDEWKEEIIYFSPNWPQYKHPLTGHVVMPAFPTPDSLKKQPVTSHPPAREGNKDRRGSFSKPVPVHPKPVRAPRYPDGMPLQLVTAWLTAQDNPWFAQNFANRTWAVLFGRGIIEPVDDIRPENPPADPFLLAILTRHVRDNKYSLRKLLRFITSSDTYQRSWRRNPGNRMDIDAWSHRIPRRLEAEVLADAIGSLTVAYERRLNPSMAQALYLFNSHAFNAKLEKKDGGIARLVTQHAASHGALADIFYLTLFSRFPTAPERAILTDHLATTPAGQLPLEQARDIAWALINSREFLYNH